jgi:hypothetical protein
MAECTLLLIKISPFSRSFRHHVGVVLQAQDRHESASECLMSAVDLEATCPIVPFTTLPRLM